MRMPKVREEEVVALPMVEMERATTTEVESGDRETKANPPTVDAKVKAIKVFAIFMVLTGCCCLGLMVFDMNQCMLMMMRVSG